MRRVIVNTVDSVESDISLLQQANNPKRLANRGQTIDNYVLPSNDQCLNKIHLFIIFAFLIFESFHWKFGKHEVENLNL